ncbi:RNA polymerase subunit sigma-70 [Microbacterium soli]|uniref:RNA polymerase subunit sigma-70 n=1 Tax=Microbacterium soli TaxID=446075 RepID=A0ABP7NDJ0_9MICO
MAAVDADEFARLVAPYRRELFLHAYRLTAGTADAEDAVQEGLLAAWRGYSRLRDQLALRAWLYRIVTNTALRLIERRGPRLLSWDHLAASDPASELAAPREDARWVEPFRDITSPEHAVERREHIELAWIAALQHLPATQRAVLILREVLEFSAAEVADILDTSSVSVNSALQRARKTLARRKPQAQQSKNPELDQAAVRAFVSAFTSGDVEGVIALLTEQAKFTMPPLPAWFEGRTDIATFLRGSVFATPWRVHKVDEVNGHPAVFGEQFWEGEWRPGALMILHLRDGQLEWLASFVGPMCVEWAKELPGKR